ncbi:unnamed protein product [Rodentolepis nana]|uniref:Uncharacterized protein n=1 Tax=Rodentolepis nana TaxID=102285 RepID=A0A3P7V8M3_RODNA|nr:unnamed protein product [Rodentolepis nana]
MLEARTKEKQWTVALSTYPTGQESKPLLSLTSKKGETVDSGTLRTDWPGIEAVADWPRIEAVAELRTVTRLPRIEAVAEFRLLGQESKPLLSLDYVLEKQWTVALSDIPD